MLNIDTNLKKTQDKRNSLHSEFLFGFLLRTGFFHNKNPAYTETTFTLLNKVAHTTHTEKYIRPGTKLEMQTFTYIEMDKKHKSIYILELCTSYALSPK